MSRYTCDHCGATLDPGERCDCKDVRVVVLHTDGTLELSVTDGKIETYQSIVGGHVEHVSSVHTIGLLVNAHGNRIGLDVNPFFPGYRGNIVLVKEPRVEDVEFNTFSEYEAAQLIQLLAPRRSKK